MGFSETLVGINSAALELPLNHLIWLNDYKTYGENSYVFQNKDILHELYKSPTLIVDPYITIDALDYIFGNCTEEETKTILQKYYYKDLNNLISNGVSFANATYTEIQLLLLYHYYYGLDLTNFWSVGDKRSVSLAEMAATGVGESHAEQTVEFAIADFDHDTLTSPINDVTNAAITLTQVGLLDNMGYMNAKGTNVGGWTSCARRAWCNDVFYNALPSLLKNMVKPVDKLTAAGNQSVTIETTSDKVFLFSEVEILGYKLYSEVGEGLQYTYYEDTSNRKKGGFYCWWTRSPNSNGTGLFCQINSSGEPYQISTAAETFNLITGICI